MHLQNWRLVLGALLLVAAGAGSAAAQSSDEQAALATVERFLEALSARDVDAATELVLPEGRLFAVRTGEGGTPVVRGFGFDRLVAGWADAEGDWRERIWDAEVRVYGRIATVAAPYDFHRDGTFSHCGVDVFDLIRTADGWRISGVLYTVVVDSCPEGPPIER